jgi:hypothetical protein
MAQNLQLAKRVILEVIGFFKVKDHNYVRKQQPAQTMALLELTIDELR